MARTILRSVRITPDDWEKAGARARGAGLSLNAYVVERIAGEAASAAPSFTGLKAIYRGEVEGPVTIVRWDGWADLNSFDVLETEPLTLPGWGGFTLGLPVTAEPAALSASFACGHERSPANSRKAGKTAAGAVRWACRVCRAANDAGRDRRRVKP